MEPFLGTCMRWKMNHWELLKSLYPTSPLKLLLWAGDGRRDSTPAAPHPIFTPRKALCPTGEFYHKHQQSKDTLSTHSLLIFFSPCQERSFANFENLLKFSTSKQVKPGFGYVCVCVCPPNCCQSSLQLSQLWSLSIPEIKNKILVCGKGAEVALFSLNSPQQNNGSLTGNRNRRDRRKTSEK